MVLECSPGGFRAESKTVLGKAQVLADSVCDHSQGLLLPSRHRERSIDFRVLPQTNKQTVMHVVLECSPGGFRAESKTILGKTQFLCLTPCATTPREWYFYFPPDITSLQTKGAKYRFSGFTPTNKQTNNGNSAVKIRLLSRELLFTVPESGFPLFVSCGWPQTVFPVSAD